MTIDKKKQIDYSHLPQVPEAILKKRHDLEELARKRKAALEIQPPKKRKDDAFYVKKPETFVARARSQRNHDRRYNRVLKKGLQSKARTKKQYATIENEEGGESVAKYQTNSVGANLVFVVRIRDNVGTPKVVRRALNALRLHHIHTGVFVNYSLASHRKLLTLVEPYVVYGRPKTSVITDLIQRRGHGRVQAPDGRERIPLSDNTIIEKALGEYNILCVEDLVYELDNVGEYFDQVSKFLYPFRLADSKTKFERKTLKFHDGKDYGDKGEEINEYIQQVL